MVDIVLILVVMDDALVQRYYWLLGLGYDKS